MIRIPVTELRKIFTALIGLLLLRAAQGEFTKNIVGFYSGCMFTPSYNTTYKNCFVTFLKKVKAQGTKCVFILFFSFWFSTLILIYALFPRMSNNGFSSYITLYIDSYAYILNYIFDNSIAMERTLLT